MKGLSGFHLRILKSRSLYIILFGILVSVVVVLMKYSETLLHLKEDQNITFTKDSSGVGNHYSPNELSVPWDYTTFKRGFLKGFSNVRSLSEFAGVDLSNSDSVELYTATFVDDPVFIGLPKHIEKNNNKVPVVVYSHGQLEYLTSLSAKYAIKLLEWSRLFAEHGYIFIAPEFYGDNWGNEKALELLHKYYNYLSNIDSIDLQGSYYLGFSMGGRLIYNYLLDKRFKASRFYKAIVLAGSVWANTIPPRVCKNLLGVNLIIYHGYNDVNVPLSMSKDFQKRCKGVRTIKLVKLRNTDHWQLGYTTDWRILQGTYNPNIKE